MAVERTSNTLDLFERHLKNMEDVEELKNLQGVKILNLYENRLTSIGKFHSPQCESLVWLDLEDNQLTKIKNLEPLTNLTHLFLGYNQISKLQDLQGLINLRLLNVNNNKIERIEKLERLVQLRSLHLNNNKIEIIENLEKLTELVVLDLSQNSISVVENLENNVKLDWLSIKDNEINYLSSFCKMQALKKLYLSGNKIRRLKVATYIDFDTLRKKTVFPNLELLALENCGITNLNELKELRCLSKLHTIDLMGNRGVLNNYHMDDLLTRSELPHKQQFRHMIISQRFAIQGFYVLPNVTMINDLPAKFNYDD